MVVGHGQLAARLQVTAEGRRRRRVQGDEAALAELGPPNLQHPLGQHVGEAKIERLGNAQSR